MRRVLYYIWEDLLVFFEDSLVELQFSALCILLFAFLRFVLARSIKRIGRKSQISQVRVVTVIRYISFLLFLLPVVLLMVIWGIPMKEMLLIFTSTFAVLGVALFATWSILSNITAGVILFFYFPYKIGDRIRIMDKDFPELIGVIIDIKAFTVIISLQDGETLTLPNNLLVQKGALLLKKEAATSEDLDKRL